MSTTIQESKTVNQQTPEAKALQGNALTYASKPPLPADETGRIVELKTLEEMLPMLPLLQQMYPDLTETQYRERLAQMLPNNGYFQIAYFEGDTCLGVSGIWVGCKLWCGPYLEFDNLVVDENARSKGVGKKLFAWAEAKANALGCTVSFLDSYVSNHASHKFYFREGYVIKGYKFVKKLALGVDLICD